MSTTEGGNLQEEGMGYGIWVAFDGYWQICLPCWSPGRWEWDVHHWYQLGWKDPARFEGS